MLLSTQCYNESGGDSKMPPKKPDSEKAIRINTSLPPDLYKRVEKFCNEEERSYAWIVQKALTEYLEKRGR